MNAEIINPFINATMNVVATMAGIQPKPGKPSLKKASASSMDYTGMVGLAGDSAKGSFAVCFSQACIEQIVRGMLGDEIEDLEQDIKDAVGEISNMISGGARAELEQKGYNFEMAVPTMITGKGHQIFQLTDTPVLMVPFSTDSGPFTVEVCLKSTR